MYEPWTETRTLWDPEELGARLTNEGFDALAVEADFLFGELFDAAPGLRIAAVCRGDLHHADLDAATGRGIAVVRTPARNAQAVAEFAVAQMLALARHTSAGERYVREGRWEDPTDPYVRFRGRELAGATLGIVGFGAIGRAVARIAAGFGMRVLACDPYVDEAESVEMTGLDALLAASDFVSVHVPDTPETMGMLDEARIAAMKPGAYLVNVTNSSVADRAALAAALSFGQARRGRARRARGAPHPAGLAVPGPPERAVDAPHRRCDAGDDRAALGDGRRGLRALRTRRTAAAPRQPGRMGTTAGLRRNPTRHRS